MGRQGYDALSWLPVPVFAEPHGSRIVSCSCTWLSQWAEAAFGGISLPAELLMKGWSGLQLRRSCGRCPSSFRWSGLGIGRGTGFCSCTWILRICERGGWRQL